MIGTAVSAAAATIQIRTLTTGFARNTKIKASEKIAFRAAKELKEAI